MESKFNTDIDIERENSQVLEQSVLKEVLSDFVKVDDPSIQKRGVDYTGKLIGTTEICMIDVKEASDYFSRPEKLQTFVLELFNTNRIKNNITNLGWGIKKTDTTHYLMIKPLERCDKVCKYFEAMLVDKNEYLELLNKYLEYMFKILYFPNKQSELQLRIDNIANGSDGRLSELNTTCSRLFVMADNWLSTIIDYSKSQFMPVGNLKLFYSGQLYEGPVNLVIPWQLLIEASRAKGWYHKIIKVDNGSYSAVEYNEEIVKESLGQEYLDDLHNRITGGYDELWQSLL